VVSNQGRGRSYKCEMAIRLGQAMADRVTRGK
jgi:hypothetical protein